MALGWLTVLKMVPWDDVIRNAPKVAENAKKLWGAVANKTPAAESPQSNVSPPDPEDVLTIARLQQQLDTTVAEIANLHRQMLESSALIQALAEQNAQLIKHVESNRLRILTLGAVLVVLVLIAIGGAIVWAS